jgi:toxin ParE1/3/4
VRVTQAAERDFQEIVEWTASQFGSVQAEACALTLSHAIEALLDGPDILGVKSRDDILPGLFSLHVSRRRRKGRHVLLFRVDIKGAQVVEVLRVVHDAMEVRQHFSAPG